MTLADAIHALAITGARLTTSPDGGLALVVPDGATVPRQVLDVLRDHREQLTPVVGSPAARVEEKEKPPAPGDDLACYLAEKGITGKPAQLIEHAVATLGIRHSQITIEAAEPTPPAPTFFENGITFTTLAETHWHEPGRGYISLPAGACGLAIPQTWAITDDFERNGIEAILESARKQRQPTLVPVWLHGRARVIAASLITFNAPAAPAGADLQPWREAAATTET